jgi:hypothetical protein
VTVGDTGDSVENLETPENPKPPIASPEPETAPTAPPESIAPLIEKVKSAETWEAAESVWRGDLELKDQIKKYLSKDELRRIGKLYKQAQSQPEAQAEPIALPEPVTTPTAPPTVAPPEPEPTPAKPEPEPAQIAPEDAVKMRDIALVWWPEMYPEGLQSLVAQMFGWGAPAKKYSASLIAQWLQGEEKLIRYRIAELMVIGLADYEDDEEDRGI